MFLTMLGDLAVFCLYVTQICSFLHYIYIFGVANIKMLRLSPAVSKCHFAKKWT